MSKRSNQNQKQKQKSNPIAAAVAIILVLVFIAGIVCAVLEFFTPYKISGLFKQEEQTEPTGNDPPANTFSGVVDGNGNELKSGETYAMPAAMTFSLNTGESSTAASGIEIEAEIKPVSALNKKIDYIAVFKDPMSAWASGKVVSDYVDVVQKEDGSATANIYCRQAFAEQVILTAVSRNDPSVVSNECTIDYAQRITGVALAFGDELVYDVLNKDTFDVDVNINSATAGKGGELRLNVELSDVYTVAQSFEQAVTFSHGTSQNGIGDYAAFNNPQGAGRSSGNEYDDPELGAAYWFDLRLFADLNFHNYSSSMGGTGETIRNSYAWVNDDYSYNVMSSVDFMKAQFDGDESENSGFHDKTLWDVSVTLKSDLFTYGFTAAFVWATVSGWQNVTDITIPPAVIL